MALSWEKGLKRDRELLRQMLLKFEASDNEWNGLSVVQECGNENLIRGHLRMLEDAGFVEHLVWQPLSGGIRLDRGWRITHAGHDFIETVRDSAVWRKTKEVADSAGAWTLQTLSDAGKQIALAAIAAAIRGGS